MTERFKDVTINEQDFQVGLVTALTGDWIARTMRMGIRNFGPEVYQKIQMSLLEKCSIYRDKDGVRVPMLIFAGGKWLAKELEYDLDTVNRLCEASMAFNFDDFFKKKFAEEEAAAKKEEDEKAALQTSDTSR